MTAHPDALEASQAPFPPPAATPSRGLTSEEAARRLERAGRNEIAREDTLPAWRIFARQFQGAMVWILAGACALSAVLAEVADAIAIASIVLLNAIVGFFQEYRAERALLALRSMTAPRARVLRDGHSVVIAAAEVVPGDVLLLEPGDVVAADARLVEAHALSTNEAPLTGESMPAAKEARPGAASTAPLAERHDTVFLGTAVATGSGIAEVVATGMSTELGKIATLLTTAEDTATPLQTRLDRVGRNLLWLCLAIVSLVALIGLLRGRPWMEVLLSAVSLAVAAVPEGLAAVVTIALAAGVQRMARRHVLVRRLPAVETLGATTVICTDKTGTLTTGQMAVREVWGADPDAVLFAAAACSDAELAAEPAASTGNPSEIAILAEAFARRIDRATIERERPRTDVQPFSPERRRMSVRRADGTLYVKGAVETILALSSTGDVAGAAGVNREMAERGLRVLAVAVGAGEEERDLRLLGLVGLADPPRHEVVAAIAAARAAGIQTVMITGDHPVTAGAIARELGLVRPGEAEEGRVHARATAADKIRIVREWKTRGAVVAMTGDGVNDAPALREAHVGIAMGRTGTEVTREASDVILTDDDYASIVAGVREGRGIYDNIRKTLVYLLTGNAGELALMLAGAIAGLPLPLLPLHLLWINLVTDGLPALALVMEPTTDRVMARPPRGLDESMLGRAEWMRIALVGLLEGGVALGAFAWALSRTDLVTARTLGFTVLVFAELFRAFAARDPERVFWEVGALTNLKLLAVVTLSIALQLAVQWIPATRSLFGLAALTPLQLALAFALALIPVSALEIQKLLLRARPRRPAQAPEVPH